MRIRLSCVAALILLPFSSHAIGVLVEGGSTSARFDPAALEAAGLTITGVSGEVIVPGNLNGDSVAFPINPRDGVLPTTFSYDSDDFAPFSGTIEHAGTVTFNESVTLGNFTIGFDGARVDGGTGASGFFVQDTFSLGVILFDIANPFVDPLPDFLIVAGDILVSPELAAALLVTGLTQIDLTGADAGAALVLASGSPIPVPAAVWLFGSALGLLAWIRRRAL